PRGSQWPGFIIIDIITCMGVKIRPQLAHAVIHPKSAFLVVITPEVLASAGHQAYRSSCLRVRCRSEGALGIVGSPIHRCARFDLDMVTGIAFQVVYGDPDRVIVVSYGCMPIRAESLYTVAEECNPYKPSRTGNGPVHFLHGLVFIETNGVPEYLFPPFVPDGNGCFLTA